VVPVPPPDVASVDVNCPTSMPGTSVMAFKGPGAWAHDAETLNSVKTAAAQA
jgi:hypothetical protein